MESQTWTIGQGDVIIGVESGLGLRAFIMSTSQQLEWWWDLRLWCRDSFTQGMEISYGAPVGINWLI